MSRNLLSWRLSTLLFLGALVAGLGFALRPAAAEVSPYIVRQVADGPAADPASTNGDDANAETTIVSQKGRAFVPSAVTLRLHRRIVITNDDDIVHHAYCSAADMKYNSGPQTVGSAHPLTFNKTGTFEIRCAIHPTMKLVVTVVP